SSWDDLYYNETKIDQIEGIEELQGVIEKEFEYADTFALKDPHLIYLFPLYQKVLQNLDIEIKVILPYQNPFDVLGELVQQESILMENGMLLWVYHFLLAEKFSRGYERVFVSFDELLHDSTSTINEIATKLHVNLESKYLQKQVAIQEFLEKNFQHSTLSMDNLSSKTPKGIKEILALKEKFNSDNLNKKFDNLYERFSSYQKLFYNSTVIERLQSGVRAKESLADMQKELEASQKIIEKKSQALIQSETIIEQKTQEYIKQTQNLIFKQRQGLEQKTQELEDANSELARSHKRIGELSYEVDQKAQEVEQKAQEVDQKAQEVDQKAQEVDQKAQEIERQKSQLEGKERKIGEISDELEQTHEHLKQTREALEQSQETLEERNREIDHLQDELIALYMGKSWRITRPLRKIMRYLKR
ncbi:MAG: hypothetical protein U9N49_08775, partial [Campylobacterota bacterium]|nr:hypothetical protein [Campylobacterota bacterium]